MNINRQAKTNMMNQYQMKLRIYIELIIRNILKLNWAQKIRGAIKF